MFRVHSATDANKIMEFPEATFKPSWFVGYREDGTRVSIPLHRIAFVEQDPDDEQPAGKA